MSVKVPGCSDCAKTASGGRNLDVTIEREERYLVRNEYGVQVGPKFRSVVAAATFMRAHPNSTLHDLKQA